MRDTSPVPGCDGAAVASVPGSGSARLAGGASESSAVRPSDTTRDGSDDHDAPAAVYSQLSAPSGAPPSSVTPDGPAHGTGLESRDAIVAVDGQDVTGILDYLAPQLLRVPAGKRVEVTVAGGETVQITTR